MSKASTDSKLPQLQSVTLKKGDHVVEYSSQILGLVLLLENSGHVVSEVVQKQALLKGLTNDYDVTIESIMSISHTFTKAFSKVKIHETHLRSADDVSSIFLVTTTLLLKQPGNVFTVVSSDTFCGNAARRKPRSKGMTLRLAESVSIVEK